MSRTRTALLLTLALAATPALAQQDISKVNGSVRAEAGQIYGDLDTINGSITVEDKAKAESLETVNGAIRVGKNVEIRNGIETVNGSVFIDRGGIVGGDIETVNGAIGLVATRLAGDIETVNGDVTVGVDSHVKGGIKIEKPHGISLKNRRDPRIVIGPNAVVEGALVFERPVTLYVHTSARIGPVTGATAKPFSTDVAPAD